jgi:hypothetical protein
MLADIGINQIPIGRVVDVPIKKIPRPGSFSQASADSVGFNEKSNRGQVQSGLYAMIMQPQNVTAIKAQTNPTPEKDSENG